MSCDIVHNAVGLIKTDCNMRYIAEICNWNARSCKQGRKKLICRQRTVRRLKMLWQLDSK